MKQKDILEKLNQLKPKYALDGVIICGIFGSYARGDEMESSDIDVVYRLDKDRFFSIYKGFKSASKISQISQEISLSLGKNIDFVSYDTTNKSLKQAIEKELIS